MSGYWGRLGNVLGGLMAKSSLRRTERISREQLQALQQKKLNELVSFARKNSPYWRERLAHLPKNFTLTDIPPVTKEELMENFNEAITVPGLIKSEIETALNEIGQDDTLYKNRYRLLTSGGSSGVMGTFVYGPKDWRNILLNVFRMTDMLGLKPGIPKVKIGAVSAPDAKHMTARGAASIDVGIFKTHKVSATAPVRQIVAELNAFNPDLLYCYASLAVLLAEEKVAGRLKISPKTLVTTSELCSPEMKQKIASAFGVYPYDSYASTETGIIAVDCEHHNGMHIFEDLVILEVVDAALNPVPDGVIGERILVTNLNNKTQPMIRVILDDMVKISTDPCPCGRTFRSIEALHGRSSEILEFSTSRGTVSMHPIHLHSQIYKIPQLLEYQIVQKGNILKVIAVPKQTKKSAQLVDLIQNMLQDIFRKERIENVRVDVVILPRLDRSEGVGKRKLVWVEEEESNGTNSSAYG